MGEKLKPCPFCGRTPEISKHFRDPIWQLIHRCEVVSPIHLRWGGTAESIADAWNTRHKGKSLGPDRK
jgi:hypothetical protein